MADYEDTNVSNLIINNISQEKFEELKTAGQLEATQVYLTPTEEGGGAALPDQTDNAGKFLQTNGTEVSWGNALVNNSSNTGVAIGVDTTANSIHATAVGSYAEASAVQSTAIGFQAKADVDGQGGSVAIGQNSVAKNYSVTLGKSCSATGFRSVAIGSHAAATANAAVMINLTTTKGTNNNPNTIRIRNQNGDFEIMDANGNVPRERLKNLVEVLPTADNGYTTVKNFGNGYVEITGYASIGTVGAGTGSEVQIDLPAGYTMTDANYWVNIAPTSETTMFDFKAEAKARSTTHFMVAYKNEDSATGLTAAGVYWEVRGMLVTA